MKQYGTVWNVMNVRQRLKLVVPVLSSAAGLASSAASTCQETSWSITYIWHVLRLQELQLCKDAVEQMKLKNKEQLAWVSSQEEECSPFQRCAARSKLLPFVAKAGTLHLCIAM